jgi:phosphoglycerate dehydrogenase-like enzyme
MQILMAQAAFERLREPLGRLGQDVVVVTLDAEGVVRRAGVAVDCAEVDPEVFWLGVDAVPRMPLYVEAITRGAHGKWVQVIAAGLDHPVFATIMAKGLRLTKSTAQAAPIAEYVMCNALGLMNGIPERRAAQARREWRMVPFTEVGSTRWLLVGFGAIGREVARRLKPFGADLVVVRRNIAPDPDADKVHTMADLPGLLPTADVVVLACSLNRETRGVAGPAFFLAMKPGAVLVNIGRGALLDEDALRAGLDRDQPAHAVLDVFQTEPLPPDSWMWDHPKVRISAHGSNAGDGLMARADAQFLENLRRYRAGEPLLGEAHPREVGL